MRRIVISGLVLLAWCGGALQPAAAGGQGYPGSQMPGGRGGMGTGSIDPAGDSPAPAPVEKPDKAATKAYNAGMKSMAKARENEEIAAKATDPEKRAVALDKVNDAYGKALDQFTEALRNKGDQAEAWNNVGYIHLRLGANNESIDDYNHALAIKPDLLDAVEHRAEALMAVDRLDDAKASYMDLFSHARPLADQLMLNMQKWLESHRSAANGMRQSDIDAFGKWVQERDGIAKQTASIPP